MLSLFFGVFMSNKQVNDNKSFQFDVMILKLLQRDNILNH